MPDFGDADFLQQFVTRGVKRIRIDCIVSESIRVLR
ncbi:MAG: hypothetical protein ACI9DC_000616 [Gammaproteobacteria bacterium]|jgi:hypothetical protein